MTQLDGKSKNIINDNIEKLKELFPEVFSEGKIDFDKLQSELGNFIDPKDERYNFTWNGKSEAKKIALTPSTGTLRPCKVESKNWDTTQNLYIEGDNLEVLKLLQKSYHKKVKMIYIDPPYNTGKDFVYKDNFRDNIKNYLEITGQVDSEGNRLSTNSETNGRYHSDWLSMMYPRLKLARNLLKDDGVIFISIDDNEVANLRKLCDEIFGEDNFVASFIVVRSEGGGLAKQAVIGHDYVLTYVKNLNNFNPLKKPKDIRGKIVEVDGEDYWIEDDWLRKEFGKYGTCPYDEIEKYYNIEKKNEIDKGIEEGKYRLIEKNGLTIVGRLRKISEDGSKFYTILKHLNKNGVDDLKNLELEQFFDFPKPISLLHSLIQGATFSTKNKNDIVLDFNSGSATTAHAVMKLNSEDGGNRKFICVQLPETTDEKSEANRAGYKNICEIGKERIRRAGEKVKSESGKSELDIGFKVLKLDSSNIKSWDSDFENLEQNLLSSVENIKSDRAVEDLLYEILLKYGLDLTLPIEELEINGKKVFNIGFGALVCCLDNDIDTEIVEKIAQLKKQFESDYGLENMRVVFRDGSFENSVVKTNALAILKQHGIDEVVSV
jgi:adenine-specific DNA-methyltransferase